MIHSQESGSRIVACCSNRSPNGRCHRREVRFWATTNRHEKIRLHLNLVSKTRLSCSRLHLCPRYTSNHVGCSHVVAGPRRRWYRFNRRLIFTTNKDIPKALLYVSLVLVIIILVELEPRPASSRGFIAGHNVAVFGAEPQARPGELEVEHIAPAVPFMGDKLATGVGGFIGLHVAL